jgi:hypothetical membrane protein
MPAEGGDMPTPDSRGAQRATLTGGPEALPAPRSGWPAWAGIVGPVLFTAAFLAQEAARRGDFDPLSQPVSALEAGPNGWIQQLNFVVFGLFVWVFAAGLHRGMRSTRMGVAGPAVLAISGCALVLAAAFPLREDATGEIFDPGGHTLSGLLFFVSSTVGLILLSRRASHDPRWRGIARYLLVAGLLAVVGVVINRTLVVPDGAPLHEWAGLAQRAMILLVVFPAWIVLGHRLLQVTRAARVTR